MPVLSEREIRTSRLTLRVPNESDRECLRKILAEPETTRPAGFAPISDEKFDEFYDTLTSYDSCYAVVLGDECIGYVHVNPYKLDDSRFAGKRLCALGFLIGRGHLRRGYGSEAVLAFTKKLLTVFDYVFGDYFEENTASGRTLAKCGFREFDEYTMYFDALGEKKHLISTLYSPGNV